MANTENADLEMVAGLWIIAKATNIFDQSAAREEAWHAFAYEQKLIMRRYGYTNEQFATKVFKTAERLFMNELKNEIFGYDKEVAA